MSNQNYITEMLELKDNNVIFKENREFLFESPFY